MGSSNPNGPPNLNKQSSFPGLPGQAAKPVPIETPSAQSASDESDTPVSLPTTPAADSSTPASGATSPATSQAGSTTNSHSNNGSSQASSEDSDNKSEFADGLPLNYGGRIGPNKHYTAEKAFMPTPLREAIKTLGEATAQTFHTKSADENKTHTKDECLRLTKKFEEQKSQWEVAVADAKVIRDQECAAALAKAETAHADAAKEQVTKQTEANQKSIAEEEARIEKSIAEEQARIEKSIAEEHA